MTREEAKELLLNISAYDIDMQRGMAKQEAIDMAIQALEQTELKPSYNLIKTELNDDAISIQALKDLGAECIAKRDENGNLIPLGSIDSLPSVSCTETTNRCDLISREWLKTAIHNFYYGLQHAPTEEDIQAYIDAAPSVSTEDTGHWSRKTKVDAYDLCGVKTWGIKCQCDRCTFTTTVVEDFGYYKYCPNCGARMREVEE